jgi:hypothetical protein
MTTTDALLDVTLPIELTNGNDGRGSRWFKSSNVRKKLEATLRTLGLARTPFDHPVRVLVIRIVGKGQRLWDASSVGRGNWKELEDAMVVCGWFVDDGPKWIKSVNFYQDDTQRHVGPAVRVVVCEPAETGPK